MYAPLPFAGRTQILLLPPLFTHHTLKVSDCPVAKVIEPLCAHLDWLGSEEGGKSEAECMLVRESMVTVLSKAMRDMKQGAFAPLRWTSFEEDRAWFTLKAGLKVKEHQSGKRRKSN